MPYPNNTITGGVSPQAQALLAYIPAPNLPGTTQNFHRQTTEGSNTTTVGARFVHNFGPGGSNSIPAMIAQFMGAGGSKGLHQNLNANFNYSHAASDVISFYPSLGGKQQTHQYSLGVGYTLGYGRLNNNFTVNWNRTGSDLRNYFHRHDGCGEPGWDSGTGRYAAECRPAEFRRSEPGAEPVQRIE